MKRNVVIYLAAAAAFALSFHGTALAQAPTENERLRLENSYLRQSVDSLKKELAALKGTTVINLWDSLEGIEEDEAYDVDYSGFGLSGRKVETEYARSITGSVPSLMLPYDDILRKYVDFYSVTKKKSMAAIIGRYNGYLPRFRKVFATYGVPEDLIPLCIVESAVSQKARSKAGAVGMWQFMPATARQYGLRVDQDVDERLNVMKSADAAARLLRDLRKSLGSWSYAVMAYNCGAGNVKKAVIKSGGVRNVWELSYYLPGETQAYIPSLVGAAYTVIHAKELGITPRPSYSDQTETVTAAEWTTLAEIARAAGITISAMRSLNAEFVSGRVPAGSSIRVPKGTAKKLTDTNQ